jgi:hypothetical protein
MSRGWLCLAMKAMVLGMVPGVLLASACTEPIPTFCDQTHPCTDPARTFCDLPTRTCVAASDAGPGDAAPGDGLVDGRADGLGPACQGSSTCVDPGAPICADGACRPCESSAECASRDPSVPACAASGRCLKCVTSLDCTDPAAPICEAAACRVCAESPECAARDVALPVCRGNGTCAECLVSADCAVHADRPVCNRATFLCEPCTRDDQCSYFCDRDLNPGQCVGAAAVLFVDQAGPSCGSGGPGSGTATDPFCEIRTAVNSVGTKDYIFVRPGTYLTVLVLGPSFRLRAELGSKIAASTDGAAFAVGGTGGGLSRVEVEGLEILGGGVNNPGFSVGNDGLFTVRNGQVRDLASYGVWCDGGTLTLDRVWVTGNSKGGVLLDECQATITNSVIAHNGTESSDFGGVDVKTPGSSFSFFNNTLVSNRASSGKAAGVRCDVSATIVNSVLWWNTPTNSDAQCSYAYSNLGEVVAGVGNISGTPSFEGSSFDDYRYMPGSPGIDVATPTGAPDHDFLGYARPCGSAPDMGAYEWHP